MKRLLTCAVIFLTLLALAAGAGVPPTVGADAPLAPGIWIDTFVDSSKIESSTNVTQVADTSGYGSDFTPYPGNPLLTLESSDPWDADGDPLKQVPGAVHPDVLYFPEGMDGYEFWMVFTPLGEIPPGAPPPPQERFADDWWWERVTLVRSHDGIHWQKTEDYTNPVIVPGSPGQWDGTFHADPDLVHAPGKGPDGESWFLYWQGSSPYRNGVAVSRDGLHYAKIGPIMPEKTRCPTVIYDEAEELFHAWYNWGPFQVGYATSTDGVHWTPYNPDSPGEWGHIVYQGLPGTYDQGGVSHMDVVYFEDQYHMYYLAMPTPAYAGLVIGHATSPDGIHWTQHPTPALVPGGETWGFWVDEVDRKTAQVKSFYRPSVVVVGDTLYMYYGGVDQYVAYPAEEYDIGLALSTGAEGHLELEREGETNFKSPGSLTSVLIAPPAGETWHRFYASDVRPAGTSVVYSILDDRGDVLVPSVDPGDDISLVGDAPIRLYAELTTSDPSSTPALDDWSVVVKLRIEADTVSWPARIYAVVYGLLPVRLLAAVRDLMPAFVIEKVSNVLKRL